MKYPNTPEYLENAPNYLVSLYEEFEADVLRDLCRRLKLSGTVTESALNQIRVLQQQGQSFPYIEKRLRQLSGASQKEIDRMFEEAVERNAAYYRGAIDKAAITAPSPVWEQALRQQADAIRRQTQDELRNFTQSMGFAIRTGNQVKFYGIAEAYQKALDKAALEVASGAMDYNTAIRGAVRDLTGSGLQWVDYASGWHNRVDVAARRAVMTGITQLSAQYTNQAMEILDTRYVETTAHGGARDKGDDFRNHKKWQGKWYYWSLHGEPDPLGKYPDFVRETGYGDVAGLCGANCRHGYFAVVPGVNEPTYTVGQLRDIDPPPFEYQGKTYTAYEATQKQRQIETRMRELKRRLIGLEASGDNKAYEENAIRLRRLSREYKAFSRAAGLRTQPERARVQGFGQKEAARARKGR